MSVRQRVEVGMMSEAHDQWKVGLTYEDFMGRWSRQLAPRFVSWLRVPDDAHWLDVGCGTGALTSAICENADPASVVGCDPVEPFIEYARQHSKDGRASFAVAGIGWLPNRVHGYGSVTSLFALNFFPDPKVAIEEMRSVTASGGTVSACVWDYAGRMEFLRRFWDVASAEDPKAKELDEGKRFPACQPEDLSELFRAGDLRDVRCDAIEIPTEFSSFDDYWRPFLGATGPAPSYVASLDADRRSALAGKLERALPRRPDGTIALIARAWAVRGTAS
jgi:SAM-dependent methyltransferase